MTPSWKAVHGILQVHGKPVIRILAESNVTSPLYLYDPEIIRTRVEEVKAAFPNFDLLYSVKSNPTLAIVKYLVQLGLGTEIVSIGEFRISEKVGVPYSSIAVTEPGKQYEELKKYIEAGVRFIHVESKREIELVNRISKELGRTTEVIIRVNPLNAVRAHENMSGPSKFGIAEEDFIDTLNAADKTHVSIEGIHVFSGSQLLDENAIVDNFRKIATLAKRLSNDAGFNLKVINFGGGFGVPYDFEQERPINLQRIGDAVNQELKEIFSDNTPPRYILELGRYLVAESGLFITKIVEVKNTRGVKYLITDSGINNFARPAMPWAMAHPCAILSSSISKSMDHYTVVGSLCQPSDVLHQGVDLPEPKVGDYVAFFNAGAYGLTMSAQFYHSKGIPAEYFVVDGKLEVIRKRIDNGDLLDAQPIPENFFEKGKELTF